MDKTILSSADNANVAPLYIYPDANAQESLFAMDASNNVPDGPRPNLASRFTEQLAKQLALKFILNGKGDLERTVGPEDIFCYMYAIFYSPMYRERYAKFLKTDFPRLPLTSNGELFRSLCGIGSKLVAFHLMEHIGQALPGYPVPGTHMVERIEYTMPESNLKPGRVWINDTQYFDNVTYDVWQCPIGGYQICQKWLKDRKGRILAYEDIIDYQRIVAALAETITLMHQIDEVIDEHGGWPLA